MIEGLREGRRWARDVVEKRCDINNFDVSPTLNQWMLCSMTFTAPAAADTKSVDIFVGTRAAGNTHSVDVDDLRMVKGGLPSGYSPVAYLQGAGSTVIAGRVGIGTATPSEKLTVEGTVRATASMLLPTSIHREAYVSKKGSASTISQVLVTVPAITSYTQQGGYVFKGTADCNRAQGTNNQNKWVAFYVGVDSYGLGTVNITNLAAPTGGGTIAFAWDGNSLRYTCGTDFSNAHIEITAVDNGGGLGNLVWGF